MADALWLAYDTFPEGSVIGIANRAGNVKRTFNITIVEVSALALAGRGSRAPRGLAAGRAGICHVAQP